MVNLLSRSLLGLAATASLGLTGCGDDGDGSGTDIPIVIDPAGTHTQYVGNILAIPASATESKAIAIDIDGDGETENALGGLLGALTATAGIDLQTGINRQIADASFILLASIKATDLANASGVGTYIFFGENPMPVACTDITDPMTCGQHLAGTGSFTVTPNSPTDSVLAGTLAGGDLTTDSSTVSIELPLGDTAPLQIELIGAQLQATVSATGITEGRIAGAITDADVKLKIIPAVQLLVTGIIEEDCPDAVPDACGCAAESSAISVLEFFDKGYAFACETPADCESSEFCGEGSGGVCGMCMEFDAADPSLCTSFRAVLRGVDDCQVELEELNQNTLVGATLLNPDLDLLDETGAYNPNVDGENDSLSLAVGFAAASATFPLPSGI